MRKALMAGNWKMNTNFDAAVELVKQLVEGCGKYEDREVLICPPVIFTRTAVELTGDSDIMVGAQNLHQEDKGAYTGEISSEMIASVGAEFVIIGHSERREYFNETDELIGTKIGKALNAGLTPVFCIGEKLEEREAGIEKEVVYNQVVNALKNFSSEDVSKVVIAYEPVWAIGTGKTATPEQAQEMHAYIRQTVAEKFGKDVADVMRILYGGSMKPENVDNLMSQPDIDGGLVGGASLKAESFLRIINFQ